jgi:transcription termination factor Rho
VARTTGSWIKGRFDPSPDGFGFVRCGQAQGPYLYRTSAGQVRRFAAAAGDIYVPPETVEAYRLAEGDLVEGTVRDRRSGERFRVLEQLCKINDRVVQEAR